MDKVLIFREKLIASLTNRRRSVLDRKLIVFTALLLGIAEHRPSVAFQLAPQSSPEERRLMGLSAKSGAWTWTEQRLARMGISAFGDPVHEEITNRIYGCNGDICAGSGEIGAPSAVLYGVRWNDDPPFRLLAGEGRGINCKVSATIRFETQPICWYSLFSDAKKLANSGRRFGQGDALLYRSHFGDLQFIHAMASEDGEPASETHRRMLDWAEFTWRISMGEYTLDDSLRDIPIDTISTIFSKSDWRVQDLFTLGAGNGPRTAIADVAFGSLLHLIQDSFSSAHVERQEASGSGNMSCFLNGDKIDAPGRIRAFNSYVHQDHALHSEADTRKAFMRGFQEPGNVVEVGRILLAAKKGRSDWKDVRQFLSCAWSLVDPSTPAGPGMFGAAR